MQTIVVKILGPIYFMQERWRQWGVAAWHHCTSSGSVMRTATWRRNVSGKSKLAASVPSSAAELVHESVAAAQTLDVDVFKTLAAIVIVGIPYEGLSLWVIFAKQLYLGFAALGSHLLKVVQVGIVHGKDVLEAVKVLSCHLPGTVVHFHIMVLHALDGAPVWAVPHVPLPCPCTVDMPLVQNTPFLGNMSEDSFCYGGPAYVAQANEESRLAS